MAELAVTVGGKVHRVACRDGEEDKLRQAAALLDERARSVAALGVMSEARTLLLAGLLLADERIEAIARGDQSREDQSGTSTPNGLDALAGRVEAIAAALEAAAASA